jgi:hypothetical protein
MSNTNQNQPPRSLPARFVKCVLEFTNYIDAIEVRDCITQDKWYMDFAPVYALLWSSYKDSQGKKPLIDEERHPEELLEKAGETVTLSGYFPYDQIILQRLGVEYTIWCDDTARQRIIFNNEVHYLTIVSEKNYPVAWCKRAGAFSQPTTGEESTCSWLYHSADLHPPYNDCSEGEGDVDDIQGSICGCLNESDNHNPPKNGCGDRERDVDGIESIDIGPEYKSI